MCIMINRKIVLLLFEIIEEISDFRSGMVRKAYGKVHVLKRSFLIATACKSNNHFIVDSFVGVSCYD